MVLAALIAAVGIYLDSPILIVGAMVVGPEFGPIAGFCVGARPAQRGQLAMRSVVALAVGFPLAITVTFARDADLQGDRHHAGRVHARPTTRSRT